MNVLIERVAARYLASLGPLPPTVLGAVGTILKNDLDAQAIVERLAPRTMPIVYRVAWRHLADQGKSAPKKVDDLVKEVKDGNPSYSDEQAWATAWSIYCKHVSPNSDHCKKPPSEYLKTNS